MFGKILNTFGTRALSAVINLLVAILLSQYLGPAGKGVQSLVITTITFVLVFANLVGGATLVYLVPRYKPSLLILPSYAWTLVVSLFAMAFLHFFPLIDSQFIIHVCILSVLSSFTNIHTSILIGKEKIKTTNLISLIQPMALILSLAAFFLVMGVSNVMIYIYSLYISFGIALVISFFYYLKYCGKIKIGKMKEYLALSAEMIRFGTLNQVAHITQMLSFRLSFYVLDQYHGEAAVGVYSNGISLAESIWLIAKSISLVQYARIANTDNRRESAALTVRLIKFSLVASLLILIPLLLLPGSFYVFLFGEGFEGTRMVIWSLAAGVLVYNFSILIGHYFSGTGRYQVNAITSSIGLVVSVILYYTLIPAFSLNGAGWATSLSYLVTSIILLIWFRRECPDLLKQLLPAKDDLTKVREEIRKLRHPIKRS